MVDKLKTIKIFNASEKALFVGPRNPNEIEYFLKKNKAQALGIDLFSESPLIKVMDMHDLKFDDNKFDLIFSSHSLEHSINPQKAVSEFIRVAKKKAIIAIEVPVNYEVTNADLIDFKDSKNILSLFNDVKTKTLFEQYLKKGFPDNSMGTDVLTLIFQIEK